MEFARTLKLEAFADEVRTWVEEHLGGEFADLRGRGGVGQEDVEAEVLREAGVPVTVANHEQQVHGYWHFVPHLESSRRAREADVAVLAAAIAALPVA